MNRSTFRMIKYMIGSVFSKARYMNGVGFEILARTPVPQLPPSYHPTPSRVDHDTARSGNIPYQRLIIKYFLRSFSPFHWFKKASCQFLAKECAHILGNRLARGLSLPSVVRPDMTIIVLTHNFLKTTTTTNINKNNAIITLNNMTS